MSQSHFPMCAKLGHNFVPGPCVPPRFITQLPKPGPSVRTSWGSSSSARPRTASRATIDDLRVAAREVDNFYNLLGISESGTILEIRQAYKQLVLKYHPDVSPPGRAKEYTERFIQVQEAYETLSDPTSRALYDRDMAIGGRNPFCYKQIIADVWIGNYAPGRITLLATAFHEQNNWLRSMIDLRDFKMVRHDSVEWKLQWESQIHELQRRSMEKDLCHESMSWGARIRRRRDN